MRNMRLVLRKNDRQTLCDVLNALRVQGCGQVDLDAPDTVVEALAEVGIPMRFDEKTGRFTQLGL